MLAKSFRAPVTVLPVPGRFLLNAAKCISNVTGRGFGFWRIVHHVARFIPAWRDCPVVGPDGQPFWIDLRDGGFAWLVSGWRTRSLDSVMRLVPNKGVVVDIGANIGTVARYFSGRVPDGRVIAFEPSPENFVRLTRNCTGHSRITCKRCAVGNITGQVLFSSTETLADLRHVNTDGTGISVPSVRLDDWVTALRVGRIHLIKVDVEGFEEEVLVPAEELLRKMNPIVVFEFIPSFALERSSYRGRALFPLFQRLGYQVHRLDNHGNWSSDMTTPSGEHPNLTNDFVAIPTA